MNGGKTFDHNHEEFGDGKCIMSPVRCYSQLDSLTDYTLGG